MHSAGRLFEILERFQALGIPGACFTQAKLPRRLAHFQEKNPRFSICERKYIFRRDLRREKIVPARKNRAGDDTAQEQFPKQPDTASILGGLRSAIRR
jgi:hypothetical protein